MGWIYFEEEGVAHRLNNYKTAFYWGYGHYFVFASAAAAGAGLAAQGGFSFGAVRRGFRPKVVDHFRQFMWR